MRNDWFEAFRLGPAEVALGQHFFIRGQKRQQNYCGTSSLTTWKLSSLARPKEVVMAQSVASRPVAIKTRPMRGMLWRASRVHQRSPRYTSNQALKSMGLGRTESPS